MPPEAPGRSSISVSREDRGSWNGSGPALQCLWADSPSPREGRFAADPTVSRRLEALDWLTRGEWNAAYFLGLERLFREPSALGFAEQVIAGVRELMAAGCGFEFLDRRPRTVAAPGELMIPPGEHSRACQEIADGCFDAFARGRQALVWMRTRVPQVDVAWLKHVLEVYREAHSPGGEVHEEPSLVRARA